MGLILLISQFLSLFSEPTLTCRNLLSSYPLFGCNMAHLIFPIYSLLAGPQAHIAHLFRARPSHVMLGPFVPAQHVQDQEI